MGRPIKPPNRLGSIQNWRGKALFAKITSLTKALTIANIGKDITIFGPISTMKLKSCQRL